MNDDLEKMKAQLRQEVKIEVLNELSGDFLIQLRKDMQLMVFGEFETLSKGYRPREAIGAKVYSPIRRSTSIQDQTTEMSRSRSPGALSSTLSKPDMVFSTHNPPIMAMPVERDSPV